MTIKTDIGMRSGRTRKATMGHRPAPMTEFKRPKTGDTADSRLMDLQDTEHKGAGDPAEATREERILVGFKMPVSLKRQLRIRSAQTGKTMAELLVEGARMRLSLKD